MKRFCILFATILMSFSCSAQVKEYKAVAADIDEDGCLIVEKDGEKRTVNSADVSVRGIMGYV